MRKYLQCTCLMILSVLACFFLDSYRLSAEELCEAPSAILMEADTGTILYEKEKDVTRSPASITKIMTLLLIFDALHEGNLSLDDLVTTSAYAKGMGGSQVYLEEGEVQTVETLIKCIVIASGNDASVAMAEHLEGSEAEFVKKMNERAKQLKMKNTHFEDCCGLTDSENHYTTAEDIAIMSRELITKYPEVLQYSSIWMENIVHNTRQGSSEFGLTNTNKLLRSFDGCVGLKTGSTSKARYCFSGVAKRKGITLIAVVMASPDNKSRFKDAANMLNYGFSRCELYIDKNEEDIPDIKVKYGKKDTVKVHCAEEFHYLRTDGKAIDSVEKKWNLPDTLTAPLKKGDTIGDVCYYMKDCEIGRIPVVCGEDSEKAGFFDCWKKVAMQAFS